MIQTTAPLALGLLLLMQGYIIPGRPRAAGEPEFSPSDISGLVFWVESDTGVSTDAYGVYQWNDQSSSSNHLSQNNNNYKPAVVTDHWASGVDGIQGDGANDHMDTISDITFTSDFSIFMVVEFPSALEFVYGRGSGTVDQGFGIAGGAPAPYRAEIADSGDTNVSTSSAAISTEYIVEFERDGSDDIYVRQNGADITPGTPVNLSGDHVINLVFTKYSSHSFSDVIYGAILMYNNKISSGDASSLRTYLNDKYTVY